MPFPLAHPAAVLPLRRYCPRWFSFPALIVGSLVPDLGYCFGHHHHFGIYSHRLVGSFGFCLPAGLLMLLLLYLLRMPAVLLLPARHRQFFLPLCLHPPGSLWIMVISLLIGVWTHIFLDSLTHGNGWLAERWPILHERMMAGRIHFRLDHTLYEACTFLGVAYVAWSYLAWLEKAAGTPGWAIPGFKWLATLILAGATLFISLINHGALGPVALAAIGVLTALLVAAFFMGTVSALRNVEKDKIKTDGIRVK